MKLSTSLLLPSLINLRKVLGTETESQDLPRMQDSNVKYLGQRDVIEPD